MEDACFTPLGWFTPDPGDDLPADVRQVILIGNAGPAMFERFLRERAADEESLDDWTRRVVAPLAQELGAQVLYPFERPFRPMQAWARRAGAGQASPLGLNIHPRYGLWHALRAALLFEVPLELPSAEPAEHPCPGCVARPCLSACPAGAFTPGHYDVSACTDLLRSTSGRACMDAGCAARHACPVGQEYAYAPVQARFHMKAFIGRVDPASR